MISVAIDGPAGAGKSTIAKKIAAKLGYIYVDTGALYRTVALSLIRNNIEPSDAKRVAEHLETIRVDLAYRDGTQIVLLNGEDVSGYIRTPEVSMMASTSSALPVVRAFLLDLQRDMAKTHDVIMDGRDIATVVLPNATVKIFLTAAPEARAKRRYDELIEKGQSVVYEEVLADVIQRDKNDSEREIAPLKPSEESVIIDTTNLNLDESVEALYQTVISVVGGKKN